MRSPTSPVLILAAALLVLALTGAQASVEPKNLVRNGDFEEAGSPPPGWKIVVTAGEAWDYSPDALTGKQALRFSLPVAGGYGTATSDPCPVTGGDTYLITFWGRGDGAKEKGGQSSCDLQWLDGAGKAVGGPIGIVSSAPTPDYGLCAITLPAPATAASAVVRLVGGGAGADYKGPTTAFLFDQVRVMHLSPPIIPPGAQTWEYLQRPLSSGLQIVNDPDAAQGQAIMAAMGSKVSMPLTWGQYTREQIPGDYLVTFRLKVKDNTKAAPVASISVTDDGAYGYLLNPGRSILATEFKQPGVYQEFTLRFVRPEEGMLEFYVNWQGTTDLYFDKCVVTQLQGFRNDKEQAAIWLGE